MALTVISIHAPRVRGDFGLTALVSSAVISIHAPRVRGDAARVQSIGLDVFQSTPLV